MRGHPKNQNWFIKNYVFILTCLNFSHLESTLHLMQCNITIETFFSTAQNSLNLSILMPFSASGIFCFTSSTSAKSFPLRTFFIGETKKCPWGGNQVNREGGAWGFMTFLVKNWWTLHVVWAGALLNHPSWNGQMHWKSLKKNFHWSWTQPLTTTPVGPLIQMGS